MIIYLAPKLPLGSSEPLFSSSSFYKLGLDLLLLQAGFTAHTLSPEGEDYSLLSREQKTLIFFSPFPRSSLQTTNKIFLIKIKSFICKLGRGSIVSVALSLKLLLVVVNDCLFRLKISRSPDFPPLPSFDNKLFKEINLFIKKYLLNL